MKVTFIVSVLGLLSRLEVQSVVVPPHADVNNGSNGPVALAWRLERFRHDAAEHIAWPGSGG
jgi:hypothetical protein